MLTENWKNIQSVISQHQDELGKTRPLPPLLYGLLIAAEDHRFASHSGVDIQALIRAVWRTSFCNRREGGSTIAMQLVRVITGRYELSINRKLFEILLALKVSRAFPAIDILDTYLRIAYFGWNMHGIENACLRLQLSYDTMTFDDMAGLIARLKYPEPRQFSLEKSRKLVARKQYIQRRFQELEIGKRYGWV